MQQRIVRAKNKIRSAGIPFAIPPPQRLGERLDALASVIYVIFSAGYAPPHGPSVVRVDLCETALAIGTLAAALLPDRPEPHALEALMRFHHARRKTRADAQGGAVLLAEQNRSLWDRTDIARGAAALRRALALPPCSWTYEAYIAAAHAHAPSFAETDWEAIAGAYDGLIELHDTPVARCNRAVALAMQGEHARARTALAEIAGTRAMRGNRYYDVACGAIAESEGDFAVARGAYERALQHATETRDRRIIERRIERLEGASR